MAPPAAPAAPAADAIGVPPAAPAADAIDVPVYVMLHLDVVAPDTRTLSEPAAVIAQLRALAAAGVSGVMCDVWWGLVERDSPRRYQWAPYQQLVAAVASAGLRLHAILSFHACGGNVGDSVSIPLPPWATAPDDGRWYTDAAGAAPAECISGWWDGVPLPGGGGRTPLECYADLSASFAATFAAQLADGTVSHVAAGAGPCGELRYPAYRLAGGVWAFPGAGAFQCHDAAARAHLAAAAAAAGHPPAWGAPPPNEGACGLNSGGLYNWMPSSAVAAATGGGDGTFFGGPRAPTAPDAAADDACHWDSPRGVFFQRWYADALLAHGERVLASVRGGLRAGLAQAQLAGAALPSSASFPQLALKVPGIHWLAGHPTRAAEATSGLYGCRCKLLLAAPATAAATHDPSGGCVYSRLAALASRQGAALDFTCLEMRDEASAAASRRAGLARAYSAPFSLVRHVAAACAGTGEEGAGHVPLGGENALFTTAQADWDTTVVQVLQLQPLVSGSGSTAHRVAMESFTLLRLCDRLLEGVDERAVAGPPPPLPAHRSLTVASLRAAGVSLRDALIVRASLWASAAARLLSRGDAATQGAPYWAPSAVLSWASPWARFVVLTRCLAAGRPHWAAGWA